MRFNHLYIFFGEFIHVLYLFFNQVDFVVVDLFFIYSGYLTPHQIYGL